MKDRLIPRVEALLWGTAPHASPRRLLTWRGTAQLFVVIVRDLTSGELALRAMGLVYITLLSVVPLLALSLAILKTLGVRDELETVLRGLLRPLGSEAALVAQHIVGFIGNIHAGVLGSAGIALLLYTSVSVVQRIESSLNFIWHVRETRPFSERFSRYLSILIVGPVLALSAVAIIAEAGTSRFAGWLLDYASLTLLGALAGRALPYVIYTASLALVYKIIPNAHVRLLCALLGALIAGTLWQATGWGFGQFLAASDSYAAIYSSFAAVILFLIWIYLSWLIVLIGASVAFYVQHSEYVVARAGEPRLSNRVREHLALYAMSLIVDRFVQGLPGLTADDIAQRAQVPRHSVDVLISVFENAGLIVRGQGYAPVLLPARDLSQVSVASLLRTVRAAGEDGYLRPDHIPRSNIIEQLMARIDDALQECLGQVNLAQLSSQSVAKAPAMPPHEP